MDKQIIEGNRLIAEFFGAKYMGKYGFPDQMGYEFSTRPYAKEESIRTWYHPEALEFHSSWDWLMPVVKKIKLTPMIKGVVMRQTGLWEKIEDELVSIKIESLWLAVVQFIFWYNTQTKNS